MSGPAAGILRGPTSHSVGWHGAGGGVLMCDPAGRWCFHSKHLLKERNILTQTMPLSTRARLTFDLLNLWAKSGGIWFTPIMALME